HSNVTTVTSTPPLSCKTAIGVSPNKVRSHARRHEMKTLDTRTRIQLQNVLFLTDFSPAADAAVPYAAEVAKRFGAKVYALHVRTPVINPMTDPANWSTLENSAEAETQIQRH